MDTSYAKGLVKNYEQNQWQIIDAVFSKDNIEDSRCVWLDINTLQGFLQQIQQPNPTGKTTTGVRIYFGAYSDTYPNPDHNDYNRLHTLVMIPTYLDGVTNMQTDYDATSGTSDFANLATISALNHGGLIPPPFNMIGPNNMYQQGDLFMDYADNH